MNLVEAETNAVWGEPLPHEVRYARVKTTNIKGRVIRCPGYNTNTLEAYGWCWNEEVSQARKPRFMASLRESILKEGLRNPVVIYAFEEGDFLSFGGSRVLAAIDCELKTVPCIINDYSGRYRHSEEVWEGNVHEFFTDVPEYYEFTPYGFETHYSMERNRRATFDPAGIEWTKGVDSEFLETEFAWLPEYDTETKP